MRVALTDLLQAHCQDAELVTDSALAECSEKRLLGALARKGRWLLEQPGDEERLLRLLRELQESLSTGTRTSEGVLLPTTLGQVRELLSRVGSEITRRTQ